MTRNSLRWKAKQAYLELMRRLPDALAVRLDYLRVFGALPNLDRPRRFSEKLQVLKLQDRDSRLSRLVDKIRVKEFVIERLGRGWVVPTLWHGPVISESVLEGIAKPAVMKANHSSAQILFLNEDTNVAAAARVANGWRTYDHHVVHREWAYRDVEREILIEPRIGGDRSPDDYKFWMFDGEVQFVQVDQGRFQRHTRQFYSPTWQRLDIKMKYPAAEKSVPPPNNFRHMLDAARILAEGFRFVRVDLYDMPERPLFGELTFSPEGGLCRFQPPEFDLMLGESWPYPASLEGAEQIRSITDAFLLRDRRF